MYEIQMNKKQDKLESPFISNYFTQTPDSSSKQNEPSKLSVKSIPLPTVPKRLFATSLIFMSLAFILIFLGIYDSYIDEVAENSFILWIFGIILLIPGLFCSIQTCRAQCENRPKQRKEILKTVLCDV